MKKEEIYTLMSDGDLLYVRVVGARKNSVDLEIFTAEDPSLTDVFKDIPRNELEGEPLIRTTLEEWLVAKLEN